MKGMETLFSSKSDEWFTPLPLFQALNEVYNFTLDPCTSYDNPLDTPLFLTEREDGLRVPWRGHTVFCNPPYSNVVPWVEKAVVENIPAVFLLPSRTDTRTFQEWIFPNMRWVIFLRGRIRFSGCAQSAPFPSCLVGFACTPPMEAMDPMGVLKGALLIP